jgi:drug/metabolite transporter (DMT)-like permease
MFLKGGGGKILLRPDMTINLPILIAVILWGLSFIATKIALDYLSPVEIITVRMLLGVPVLFLILKLKRISIRFRKPDYVVLFPASIILAGHFLIQAFGLIYTTATNTAWLIATIPVFIAILAYVFLKEKLAPKKILGIAIATFGVLLLISKGRFSSLGWLNSSGDWLILASCITWSVYTIITRNITRRKNPLAISFTLLLLPAILLTFYTLLTVPIGRFTSLPFEIIGLLVFLGVFCLGLAHWLWLEGLSKKSEGAINVGVYRYFEPVVTTIAAIPILGERLTFFMIIGAIFIVGGVYLVEKRVT